MTVQFQSVVEKLTPHDTIFTFATSSELRDSKLSAACSLHTASASVKSSNESLPQQGLAEITEDASESPIDKAHDTKILKDDTGGDKDRPTSGVPQFEETNRSTGANRDHSQSLSITRRSPPRPRTSSTDKALPPRPQSRDKTTPHAILDYGDPDTRRSIEGRLSSQSGRPSTRDTPHAYEYKPKVKLGPRPSMDSAAGRLEKSNGTSNFRPVSTLPAGLRMPPQKVVSGRPKSSQAQSDLLDRMPSRQPLPPAPMTPIRIPDRNAAIANNGLPTPAKTPEPKSPKMTPEKRRLMKALQLRQKQLASQKVVTGNGIDAGPDELENTGRDTGESVPSTVANGTTPPTESDLEQVPIGAPIKEEHRDVETSPISLPETSEEPSTQASSITDDEEVLGRRKQDLVTKPESTRSEPSILAPSNSELATSQSEDQEETKLSTTIKDGQGPATSDENLDFEVKAQKPELVRETLPLDEQRELTPPHSPSDSLLKAKDRLANSEGHSEEDNEDITEVGLMPAIHSPALEDVGPFAEDTDATEEVSQTVQSEASNKFSEQGFQGDHGSASHGTTEDIGGLEASEASSLPTKKEPLEHLNASEVPLPPIDNDEELNLSAPQAPSHAAPSILVSSSKPEVEPLGATSIDKCQSQTTDATATQTPSSNSIDEQNVERRVRRQGIVNPMQRVSSSDHLEEHFLSDESFMEELKSATLQEAKPISVSKSPMKPVFSRSESEKSVADTRASRSVSSPLTPQSLDVDTFTPRLPTPLSARSFSASQSPRAEAQQPVPPLPKKIGVSTGISQRIKALEQLSARPVSPSSQAASPNASAFTSLRKTSQRGAPVASDAGNMNSTISRPSTAYPSPTSSPDTVKSNPFKKLTKLGSTRPESVTVTATIIRDAKNKTPETPLNLSEPRAMDLHQSPLVVEHQPMGPPPLSPLKPPRPRYARYSSARSGSSSSTDRKGDASPTKSPTRRRDSFASIRSRSSRATSDAELPRTISDNAPSGATTPDGTKEEKRDSKRSRLMKRMSSISSMSRRSIAQALSPSPKESPIMEHHEPVVETPPSSSVDIGDVNVQFPDTLVRSATSHS